jgi:hypothetical protein
MFDVSLTFDQVFGRVLIGIITYSKGCCGREAFSIHPSSLAEGIM